MNKILLIIQREYFSRVKKKSFLLMTFLVPTLFIAMYAVVIFIFIKGDDDIKNIRVLDESGVFANNLQNKKNLDFKYISGSYNQAKEDLLKSDADFLLYIPKSYEAKNSIEIISEKKPGLTILGDIEGQMATVLQNKRLIEAGIDTAIINKTKAKVSISAKQLTAEGEKDASVGATFVVGFVAAFLIYISLFIYGTQVMRGVIEEKTTRIIEVIVSSVKPFQLMLGKILGIGMVGLTQFLLWIILSVGLATVAGTLILKSDSSKEKIEQMKNNPDQALQQSDGRADAFLNFSKAADTVDFPYILTTFLFYFLGGYLIYSALFAAVGSAVDNETETQQFMLPITLPLIFTFIIGMNFIVNNPDSPLSFWLSMIPFTSPIAMMIRIPFGVPVWELALSMALLVAGFIFTTWVASRIYRVGILMYGKKTSYKEIAKWFMYKE
ncbi:ABC transporter permease [Daejeonella oryzae]|uniref:ABC transporter permease n=1 Tax=Daejeonella oryzae TaxID=1122943 RepID=UPI0004160804|nr:ABC transporter permease [Daejeonella oryzae]